MTLTLPQVEDCTCEQCVSCCEHNPGWMTPDEAQRAIDAGLAGRMMCDWLEPCEEVGNDDRVFLICPASLSCEGSDAPEMPAFGYGWCKGACTFLSRGLCEIHDSGFKPSECRAAKGCDDSITDKIQQVHYDVAALWNSDEGRRVVENWKQEIEM